MDRTTARVRFNHIETPGVCRLGLAWDATTRGARAARFVMLALPDPRQQTIPRPFSISDVWTDRDGTVITEFLYKRVGETTRRMAGLQAGDEVLVTGLLGNGFPLPQEGRRPVLLAGGIGNAPFALQARELVAGPFAGRAADVHLFLAARGADDLWIQDIVRELGITVIEVTDDGSRGEKGRITEILARRLPDLGPIEAFACGPEPMLHAVREMALSQNFPCWLSVEERMACGYGVCNACVVEECRPDVRQGEGRYLRACIDGPVFEARSIYS